jgi:arginine-tRNA-protein transferase
MQEEHFQLYQRYLKRRHRHSQMLQSNRQQYLEFLTSPWSSTFFCEFRLQRQLLAVAVLDRLRDGLSAVYTFFDPDFPQRGLGVFALLWSIAECRRLDLDWLYLGYWIEGCAKMHYKMDYRPQERFVNGQWTRCDEPTFA